MIQADTSIYRNMQGPDLMGSYMKGQNFRQMMDQRERQKAQFQRQEQSRKLLGEAIQPIEGGGFKVNAEKMSDLAQASPETFMQLQKSLAQQNQSQAGMEQTRQNTMLNRAKSGFMPVKDETGRVVGMQRDPNYQKPGAAYQNRMASLAEQRLEFDRQKEKGRLALAEKKSKSSKDMQGRFVPGVGMALTTDDAKKLKTSSEMKSKFDRQIGELIDLRTEYGVEYLDRNAVGRGKQLSKDLLLTYKNLAKLGVLSKSDEDIVNAIIPADPLGQDMAPGQDPILHKLKKFKGDLDDDYKTTIKTRIQPGKPANIIQNGHTYTLNPNTGQYE